MAPPIYFFPKMQLDGLIGNDRFKTAVLRKYGLDTVLDGIDSIEASTWRQEMTSAGPGGASGSMLGLLAQGKPPLRTGYVPAFQTWTKTRNEPELWLGIDTEHPPGPADLQRDSMIAGYPVRLSDGREYEVPIIWSLDPACMTNLPQQAFWDADDEFVVRISPASRELYEEAVTFAGRYFDGESMTVSELMGYGIRCLGVNYRYGKGEHGVLNLIDTSTESIEEVLRLSINCPWLDKMEAAQKKTDT